MPNYAITLTEHELSLVIAALEAVRPGGGSSEENNLLAKLPGRVDMPKVQRMVRTVVAEFLEQIDEDHHGITVDIGKLWDELKKAELL